MTPANGTLHNGSVWLDGQPVALDLRPDLKRDGATILREHVAEQRAYIGRLTASVARVECYLDERHA